MHTIGAYLQDKAVALAVHTQNGFEAFVAGTRHVARDQQRRLRDETGQTAVEYAGILVLIALVIGAVFALNLNDRLLAWGNSAINSIGDHCEKELHGTGCKN
jgi:Flp pilus assembly pilin Flp